MAISAARLRLWGERQPAGASLQLMVPISLTAIWIISCAPSSSSTGQAGSTAAPPATIIQSAGENDSRAVPVRSDPDARRSDAPDKTVSRDENSAKLDELLASREADGLSDFTIGPGDVLEVSVPAIEQLKTVQARVLENGTIMLPLLGRVPAGGMTQEQFEDALRERLRQYMYKPQLSVFVQRYQSREVSVMGALDKPGLYTLASPHETIISMIGKAGGLTDKAGSRVFLIPGGAEASSPNTARMLASNDSSAEAPTDPAMSRNQRHSPERVSAIRKSAPISAAQVRPSYPIDRNDSLSINLGKASDRKYLKMPARPGDLIIVTQAGQVAVQGWVQTPGAFNITPGMTLLGAVAAAGGELFSSQARILRTGDSGEQITNEANLRRIRNREEPDIPVQAGDVVVVEKSVLGSGPYLVYTLFNKFNTGMYMPVP